MSLRKATFYSPFPTRIEKMHFRRNLNRNGFCKGAYCFWFRYLLLEMNMIGLVFWLLFSGTKSSEEMMVSKLDNSLPLIKMINLSNLHFVHDLQRNYANIELRFKTFEPIQNRESKEFHVVRISDQDRGYVLKNRYTNQSMLETEKDKVMEQKNKKENENKIENFELLECRCISTTTNSSTEFQYKCKRNETEVTFSTPQCWNGSESFFAILISVCVTHYLFCFGNRNEHEEKVMR